MTACRVVADVADKTGVAPAEIRFTVYGVAAPAGSKTIGRTKTGAAFIRDASSRSAPWKRQVAQLAGVAMAGRPLFEGPLELTLRFVQARPKGHFRTNGQVKAWAPSHPIGRPDATKLTRAVEDGMLKVVYRDDSQIVRQVVSKEYGEPARCEITVRGIEG